MPRNALTFERTHNMRVVREIIAHPKIYPYATDDGSVPRSQYEPEDHPCILYILVSDGDELLGLFMFVPETSVCLQVHTCLLPQAIFPSADDPGGVRRSIRAAHAVRQWIWENTPCRRITTHVPAYNRLALLFAQKAGLIEFGRNPMSLLKNGLLHDQILLGISRPEGI